MTGALSVLLWIVFEASIVVGKKGEIGTDDSINLIKKDNNNNDVTIENIVELIIEYKDNKFTYGKSSLRSPKCWKQSFLEKLSQLINKKLYKMKRIDSSILGDLKLLFP